MGLGENVWKILKGLWEMSMTAVIESIERDALRQAMKPEGLFEKRCQHCNRLLGKFNGQAEIKCPKCGKINRIGVKQG